jgi:hypothetical protein
MNTGKIITDLRDKKGWSLAELVSWPITAE